MAEVERLHEIRSSRFRIGIVYVSHFLEELLETSDNLVILRIGRRVTQDIAPWDRELKTVVTAMLGKSPESLAERAQRVDDAHGAESASHQSRSVRCAFPGCEVRAIYASTSSKYDPVNWWVSPASRRGRRRVVRGSFGTAKAKAGSIILPTGAPAPGNTARAVKSGIAYTPADRKQFGLMLRQSVTENVVSVRTLTLGRDGFVLRAERLRRAAAERCRQLGVVAGSMDQPVGALSGGNQQKVVLPNGSRRRRRSSSGRSDPRHRCRRQARNAPNHASARPFGKGCAVYSSDPGEIVAVADRVVVFVDGAMTKELDGTTLTEHELVTAINTGVKPAIPLPLPSPLLPPPQAGGLGGSGDLERTSKIVGAPPKSRHEQTKYHTMWIGNVRNLSFQDQLKATAAVGLNEMSMTPLDVDRNRAKGSRPRDMRKMAADLGVSLPILDPMASWAPHWRSGISDPGFMEFLGYSADDSFASRTNWASLP